jgi:beta-N-acetylhexosaminidase
MKLEQKIGQMLVFGWIGETDEENTTVSAHARALVEELEVGGVILMGRNIAYPLSTTAKTINELQGLSKIPLFVSTDQEGGMVARFTREITLFPSNMAIGATGDPSYAYRAAKVTAEELKAIGINYDFAPSVDVNNNPDKPCRMTHCKTLCL